MAGRAFRLILLSLALVLAIQTGYSVVDARPERQRPTTQEQPRTSPETQQSGSTTRVRSRGTSQPTTSQPAPSQPTTPTTNNPSPTTPSGGCLDGEEAYFLQLINNFRAQNGLGPVTLSATLTAAADYHSTDMANRNYFSHDLPGIGSWVDNIRNAGYSGGTIAENIAAGNGSAQATFEQWANSAGHRANVLNPSLTAIGIGRAYSAGSTYGWYWTTTFGSGVDSVGC